METKRTRVSKSHPAVKALITKTFPNWKGRKVTVIEASPDWEHYQYHDDLTKVFRVYFDDGTVYAADRPSFNSGFPKGVSHRVIDGAAVVMLSNFMGEDMGVEIIIPAADADTMTVALDAAIAGNKSAMRKVLHAEGMTAGILTAVVEAKAKTMMKAAAA